MTEYSQWSPLILKQFAEAQHLRSNHKKVLAEIIDALSIHWISSMLDVNEAWKDQMKIEAYMIFLVGYYGDIEREVETKLAEAEARLTLGIPRKGESGEKYTVDMVKALIMTDDDIMQLKGERDEIRNLNRDLALLLKVVMGRNQKLDHLSVNFRREFTADENAD